MRKIFRKVDMTMKRTFKSILSLVLVISMIMGMGGIPAVFAADSVSYDISTMTDADVAKLCVQLAADADEAALAEIENQLNEADRMEAVAAELGKYAPAEDVYLPDTAADEPATVKYYKQLTAASDTSIVVDAKYFEYVGTAADVYTAAEELKNAGEIGGLIDISEGTLTVSKIQQINFPNLIIRGVDKEKTVVTGNSSNYNNTTNGLACITTNDGLSDNYKALFRFNADNIKLMDITVDAGACGYLKSYKIFGKTIVTDVADLKTIRVNSGSLYMEDVIVKGPLARTNLIVGTSSSTVTVNTVRTTVNKAYVFKGIGYSYGDTEITNGSTLIQVDSMLGGAIVGAVGNLGAGYYEVTTSTGVTGYTTIPHAIELYADGVDLDVLNAYCTADDIHTGKTVAAAMTADLTTITTGAAMLLYGKNCDEMKDLAAEFKAALERLSSSTGVDAADLLAKLAAALEIESWHTADADNKCTACGMDVPVAVTAPNATVSVLPAITLTPENHDYMTWPSGNDSIDRPLQIVMNFKAIDTLEECVAGPFSKYLCDFYLKVEGLRDGSIIADNCYLAGNYGSFGWIVIPADGLKIENGVEYPIVSAYDATLNYKDICGSVKDFTAAIYISEKILDANPDFKVTLSLKMTNPDDANDVITVGTPAVYTNADLRAGIVESAKDAFVQEMENSDQIGGEIDETVHAAVIGAAREELKSVNKELTDEQIAAATVKLEVTVANVDYVENTATPTKVVYDVTPMLSYGDTGVKISTFNSEITFKLPVPAEWDAASANVYHKGVLHGTYIIKEENGQKFVEVSSANFSEYAVEPVEAPAAVAKVNGVEYTDLQAAIDAAQAVGTAVIMLADYVGDITVSDGYFSIYLEGHTITGTIKQTGGVLTLNGNGKIQNTGLDDKYPIHLYDGQMNIVGSFTVEATGTNGVALYSEGNKMNVDGNITVIGNAETAGYGIMNISKGTFEGALIQATNSSLAISGGSYKQDPSAILKSGFIATLTDGYYVVTAKPFSLDSLDTDSDGAYLIKTAEELISFRDLAGSSGKAGLSGQTIKLANSINLSGYTLGPSGDDNNRFCGTFDGQGYTISNMTIEAESTTYVGFFASASGATIKDVIFENVTVNGAGYTAAVVGRTRNTTIDSCELTGEISITGTARVGGILGGGVATITDCSVSGTGKIEATIWGAGGIAGLVSAGSAEISGNVVEGITIQSEDGYTGGIAAWVQNSAGATQVISENQVNDVTIIAVNDTYADCNSLILGATQTNATITLANNSIDNTTLTVAEEEKTNLYDAECEVSENVTIITPTLAVAKVNGVEYETLEAALAAANAGDTVELLANVTVEGSGAYLMINKEITIDGNNYTVSMKSGTSFTYALFYLYAINGTVTVKNLTFDGITSGAAIWAHDADLVIDNCVFQNCNGTQVQGLVRTTTSNLTVKGSKFINNNCNFVITFNYDVAEADTMVVENCEFTGNTVNDTAVIYYVDGASSTIKDSSFVNNTVNSASHAAVVYYSNGANGTVTGNVFSGNTITAGGARSNVLALEAGTTATGNAFVNNTCTTTATGTIYVGTVLNKADADTAGVVISDNYWGGNEPDVVNSKGAPTALDSYYKTYENGTLSNRVEIKAEVAEINGVKYATLAEAAAAATAGDTITLLADATIAEGTDVTIPGGVTLNGNGFSILSSGADHDSATNYGYVIAGGNLTIEGVTKIEKFSASYYNHIITIGEGASLQVTGKNRVSLGYGSSFDVTGTITDAKTADKSTITPSLLVNAGFSIVGSNDTYLKVTNAYVKIGSTTSKNSNAGGKFDISFTNSIVEFTDQFTTVTPRYNTLNPVFNVTFEDSVVTTATKMCLQAPGSNVVVDNSDVTLGTNLHNSGTLTVQNGSTFTGSMIHYGENGGNSGTITVDNASFTIKNNNAAYAMDGNNTGKLILKNNATASVDYIAETAIELGVGSALTSKSADLTVTTDPSYEVNYENGKYVAAQAPVAMIGESKYYTLKDALFAAQEGDTIQLTVGEIDLDGGFTLPNTMINVTINGAANHASVIKNGILLQNGSRFNLTGVTFEGIVFDDAHIVITPWDGNSVCKDITVNNCIFQNLDATGLYATYAPIHITNGGQPTGGVENLIFTNNVVKNLTGGNKSGVYAWATGNIVIENNIFDGIQFRPALIQVYNNDGVADSVSFTGNTVSNSPVGRLQILGTGTGGGTSGTDNVDVNINNNIFADITQTYQLCVYNMNAEKTDVDFSKNYFDIDIEANPNKIYYNSECTNNNDLIAAGVTSYYAELNEDGTINAESETVVEAQISSVTNAEGTVTYYETLEAAIAAAQDGDTVTLLDDVTVTSAIKIHNKGLTIDGNGKVITFALTSTGSGIEINTWSTAIDVSEIEIKNVTLTGHDKTGGTYGAVAASQKVKLTLTDCVFAGNTGDYAVFTDGTILTVDGCEFTNNDCKKNVIVSGANGNSNTVVITDSVFTDNDVTGASVIYLKEGSGTAFGTATVSNCTFTNNTVNSTTNAAVLYCDTVEITGNVFTGNKVMGTGARAGVIVADGGAITGNAFVSNTTESTSATKYEATVVHKGDTADLEISENYWNGEEPDYIIVKEDGTVTVESYYASYTDGVLGDLTEVATPVAEVNGVKYETLAAALAAANDGDTVTLIADVVLTQGITVSNKSITLDGNGYSISAAADANLGYQAVYFYNSGETTIKNVTFKNFVQSNVSAIVLRLESSDKFTLTNVSFDNCDVAKGTNTVYSVMRVYDTDFTATNLNITNCKAAMLMDIGPSSDYFEGLIEIKDSKFENNEVLDTALIYTNLNQAEDSYLSIDNTQFVNNVIGDATSSSAAGRGVIHLGSDSVITNSTFDGNRVYGSHANNVSYGINEYSGYDHVFSGNTFKNSTAYQTNTKVGPVSGAAIMTVGSAVLENNVVEDNNAFYNRASVDAEFTAQEVASVGTYSDSYGKTTIVSGTYNGKLATYTADQGFAVKGGTYSTAIPDAFCADGFVPADNGNGTYGVAVDPAFGKVAMIGDTYYATLAEAIAAANDGDTVTLIADVEVSRTIQVGKNITIDGNGHKLTPASDFTTDGHNAVIALASADAAYNANRTITVKNLTFEGFTTGLSRVIRANFCNSFIENCTFNNNTVSDGVITSSYGALNVNGCEFNNNTSGFATVNVGFDVSNGTELVANISGNSFTDNNAAIAVVYLASSANVTGNSFANNVHTGDNANAAAILAGPYTGNMEYTINVTGNAFVDAMSNGTTALPSVFAEDWSNLGSTTEFDLGKNYWNGGEPDYEVSGAAPSIKLDDYYTTYENGELGGLTDTAVPVAEINGVGYASIQEAVNAAKDGDTIIIKEGNHNVFCPIGAENNATGRAHNLFINKDITLKGEGNVVLYSYQETYTSTFDARITVLISGTDGVVLDNLTIYPCYYPTTASSGLVKVSGSLINEIVGAEELGCYYNQIIDTMRSYNNTASSKNYIANVTVQNCVIGEPAMNPADWGSAIYFPGVVGNATNFAGLTGGYAIKNNVIYGGICICEGAAKNATADECIISGNTIHGGMYLNGKRPTGWNYVSLTVFPIVTGNTFTNSIGNVDGNSYYISSRDGDETAVIPAATLESYLNSNTFIAEEGLTLKALIGSYAYSETATEYYGLITAVEETPVAEVNGVKYATIQAAVDAATAGDTVTVIADVSDEAVEVNKSLTITGDVTLTNVSINAVSGATELTVSGLTFTGNSWINSGAADKLTVSGVTANVTPNNTSYTNSRSAFISLGRSEQKTLELVIKNSNIVAAGGANPVLGWASITKATITGNTFGSESAHQAYSDSIKFMSIADGAVFTITGNTIYSDYNGIVFGQNTTRGNAYTANISHNTFVGGADHVWIEVSGSATTHATINATSNNTVNGNAFTAADIKLHPNLNTFTSYLGVDVVLDGNGKVIGGTFAKIADDVIAEGYETAENADGTYGVVEVKVYVAEVNGVQYESLQDAINAANGGTVKLLADITYDTVYTSNKTHWNGDLNYELNVSGNVTLDLNGYEIKSVGGSSHSYYALICVRSGSLTVMDSSEAKTGAIICSATTAENGVYAIYNNAALTVNSGTISNTVGGRAIQSVTVKETSLTINGGTIASTGIAIRVASEGDSGSHTVVINGGTINANSYAIWAPMKNGSNDTTLDFTVTDGTFNGKILFNCYNSSADFSTDNIAIEGGTFNGNVLFGEQGDATADAALIAAVTDKAITGGTFVNDIKAYVVVGETVTINEESFTKAPAVTYVAEVNGVQYESLQDAINAANGGTVKLLADIEATVMPTADAVSNVNSYFVTVAKGNTVTIDLNGKTISVTGNDEALYDTIGILNYGNLTIDDSVGTGKITFAYNGNMEKGTSQIHSTILNFGTLTVNGGTIENKSTKGYGRYTINNYSWGGNANVTINGGYISNDTTVAVYADGYSDFDANSCNVTVTSGTIDGGLWYNGRTAPEAEITVTGGTFIAGTNGALTIKSTPTSAVISGGEFNGAVSIKEGVKAISGGTFSEPVAAGNCAEGFIPTENADGTYGVVEGAYVAEVNGVKYATLAEAFAAAEDGDTVTLLDDIALDTTVVNTNIVTLDLNGKTITGTDNNTSGNFYLINNNKGNLTIDDSVGGGKITLTATNERNWSASSVAVANNLGTLTIKDGTIEHLGGTSMAYAIDNLTNGANTVATLNIEGGTINSTYFAVRQFANNGTNNLNISGGDIQYVWMQSPNNNANVANISVTGGSVDGICLTGKNAELTLNVAPNTTGEVYGTAPAGDAIVGTPETGFGLVAAVATVNGVGYATLAEAIAAAQNDGTIVVLEDVVLTETLTVPASAVVTLDLNGKTISQTKAQTDNYQMILNDGNLTIVDNIGGGKISYTDSGNGGEYVSNTITNRGTITVKSGTVENLSSATVANNGYPYAIDTSIWGTAAEVNVKIEGGKVYGENYSAIRLRADSTTKAVNVTVTGGEIVGTIEVQNPSSSVAGKGALTITGGTLSNSGTSNVLYFFGFGASAENITVSVTGGKFTGNITESSRCPLGNNFNKNFISGGTFSAPVAEEFCAEGYIPADNGDGTYGVVEGTYVAEVNGVKYTTVTDAINAANDGDTVYLLPGTITEYIAPWAADPTHASEKSITIIGAENFGTTLTGGMYLGYDDNGCRAHTITVKGIAFEGKGIVVAGQQTVVIDGNKFTGITDVVVTNSTANANAISILGKDVDATVTNNIIDGVEVAGINLRNVTNAIVTDNTITNTKHNSITVSATNGTDTVVIENNNMSNWGLGGDGRAMRISDVENATATGNVMSHTAAPEEFVKLTGATTIDASENYWNGEDPTGVVPANGKKYFNSGSAVLDTVILKNYYTDADMTNLVEFALPAAEVNGTYYATVTEAIMAAMQTGGTVTLVRDVTEVIVSVVTGVKLDLNGYTLTATYFTSFGDVIDGEAGGNGGIKSENVYFLAGNTFMPIYDSDNACYKFYKYEIESRGSKISGDSITYGLAIRFTNKDAYLVIKDSDNFKFVLSFYLSISTRANAETRYAYSVDGVKDWANHAYEYYTNTANTNDLVLTFRVSGISKLEEGAVLTMRCELESNTSFKAAAEFAS